MGKKIKYIRRIVLASSAVLLWGCEADLMDTTPYDKIASESMWKTESLADNGVMGVYQAMRSSFIGLIGQGSSIESFGGTTTSRTTHALASSTMTGYNSFVEGYWKAHYEGIHRANDAIANLHKAPLDEAKYKRLMAEVKFLRAYYYYRLNCVFRGVPLYLEDTEFQQMDKGRSSEANVWQAIIDDLTDCIQETNLPDKYAAGNADYGRITKGAAYALRGKTYLWIKEWKKAESDFKMIGPMGYGLFQGGYKELFKLGNEQCEEMIFSVQCISKATLGNELPLVYGNRSSYGSCWNHHMPSTDFVNSFECLNGKPFSWDDYFTGYSTMSPLNKKVFFLRDELPQGDQDWYAAAPRNMNMSNYLVNGNEARLTAIYENRDPRLMAGIITPYTPFYGNMAGVDATFYLRHPWRSSNTGDPVRYDLQTDTNSYCYYLYRKFVPEGSEIEDRSYSPLDIPLIRYADVLLGLAEALNEQPDKVDEAVTYVNLVRERAGIAPLNESGNPYVAVAGQDDLRKRIQNERRWELYGEAVLYFDELRGKTLKDFMFREGAGLKQIWDEMTTPYTWGGDHYYVWPIPSSERQKNTNLTQNENWPD